MKSYIRSYLIHLFVLWITPTVFTGGFNISNDISIYLFAAFVFTLLHIFVRPLLRLLLLPISLATLGLASWLVHVVILYILILIVPQIQISPWNFSGFSYKGFIIPATSLSFFWTLLVVAFFMGVVITLLDVLMH